MRIYFDSENRGNLEDTGSISEVVEVSITPSRSHEVGKFSPEFKWENLSLWVVYASDLGRQHDEIPGYVGEWIITNKEEYAEALQNAHEILDKLATQGYVKAYTDFKNFEWY